MNVEVFPYSHPPPSSDQYDWIRPNLRGEQHAQERAGSFKEVGKTMLEKTKKVFRIRNTAIRQMLAEALGTFIVMVFGLSSVAQVVLGKGKNGQYLSINIAFGIGVTLGIYAAGGISDAIYAYSNGNLTVSGPNATAMIFSTYPAPNVSLQGAFFTEFTATVMLILGILVIHDEKNNAAIKGAQPVLTGLLVLGIGLGMGLNTGYAINPSRDLPPRIFMALAGWGMAVFTGDHSWWWVPVTAPVLGSLFGVFLYKLCIDFHNQPSHETEHEKEQAGMETSRL
nr:aquaporin-3-like isoform X3 [Taeniopygia guttata]